MRILLVIGVVAVTTAVGLLVALLLIDRSALRSDAEVPTVQAILGLTLSGLGLIVMVVGLVLQFRGIRRNRAWRSPMYVLARHQRKSLLAQVRGRAPVVEERLPLARHLAGLLTKQRVVAVGQGGLLVLWIGLSIAQPSEWRLWFTVVIAVFGALGAGLLVREARRAQRFLDAHPQPAGTRADGG